MTSEPVSRMRQTVDLGGRRVRPEPLAHARQVRDLERLGDGVLDDAPDHVVGHQERRGADRGDELTEPGQCAARLYVSQGADEGADRDLGHGDLLGAGQLGVAWPGEDRPTRRDTSTLCPRAVGRSGGQRWTTKHECCYNSAVTSSDPTAVPGRWDSLHTLLRRLDDEIGTVYTDRGVDVRPRFVYPLIRLAHTGPLTIRELAESLGRTHSAMSQTVTAMRNEGLVETESGQDARTRRVALTDKSRALVPLLEAEWRATEESVAEIDDELPYALSTVVEDLERVLARRSLRERLVARLDAAGYPVPHATEPDARPEKP
jgi:DNA-binding MarR family transcriptional regulator